MQKGFILKNAFLIKKLWVNAKKQADLKNLHSKKLSKNIKNKLKILPGVVWTLCKNFMYLIFKVFLLLTLAMYSLSKFYNTNRKLGFIFFPHIFFIWLFILHLFHLRKCLVSFAQPENIFLSGLEKNGLCSHDPFKKGEN